jgi:hypothetical protein
MLGTRSLVRGPYLLWSLMLTQYGACLAQEPSTVADVADVAAAPGAPDAAAVVYEIKPSETDSAIRRFDDPHYVVFDPRAGSTSQLVVFMPGTDSKPENAARLLKVVAGQGYRVIGLEYNDSPAVIQVCPHNPSPNCSGDFRRKRIFGDDVTSLIDNTPAESIVNRLVRLLEYLVRNHPGEGWADFLAAGEPNWGRIVISGLSQGAGMAAYIAKRKPVARVVLFSSPWDYSLHSRTLAPWIGEPSVTPPERWFAEYHKRENTADVIAKAYVALQIPAANIRVFDLEIPWGTHRGNGKNPYHGSTIKVPGYEPQWRFLFGHSP